MKSRKSESGFTLIELLTVVGIISVLAGLALTSFRTYRGNAAYAVVDQLIGDGKVDIEGTVSNADNLPGGVGLINQRVPGPLNDASARAVLPALQVPRNVSFSISFDPSCNAAGCQSAFLEARHQFGREYVQWIRFGDGVSVTLDHIAGAGF